MKYKIILICAITIAFFNSYAQFEKTTDSEYFMSFEPVVGTLHGNSNIANGVNPNLTLQSKGFLYGIDWVSARWANVEGDYFLPTIQCPIKIRSMRSNEKGLKTSDGTYFPKWQSSDSKDKPTPPFSFFDCSIDLYISPFYFKTGSILIAPKFGLGLDLAHHAYELDLSKYIGKEGTDSTLGGYIASSYSPYYSYTFWEDLYGFNLGSYFCLGKNILIDAGWEFYPGRLMTKMVGNTINTNYNAMPGTYKSRSSKLSRFTIEGQLRIVSWFSVFAKYENSNYKFEGPIIYGDQKFYQRYSNILFGITLGGPR